MRGISYLILGAVTGATACSVYDSSLLGRAASSAGGAGGSTAGSGGSGATSSGGGTNSSGGSSGAAAYCLGAPQKTFPPKPPPQKNDAGKDDVEAVSVQYTIDLGDSNPVSGDTSRYRTIGFDLDKFCSAGATLTSFGECLLPSGDPGVLDGPGGVDNALGGVIQKVRDLIGSFSSENYTTALQTGASNIIYRISQWNGQANDDQVLVETYVAAPFDSIDNPKGSSPKWAGNDVWPIASDSVNGGVRANSRYRDANAYVANYQVVASLKSTSLRLDVGLSNLGDVKLDMLLRGSIIVCNLEPTDAGPWGWNAVSCTLGGRWRADDLVHQLGQFPNPSITDHRAPLCTQAVTYPTFKANICQQIDTYSGINGIADATTECDSLSMGVYWTSRPAILGDVYTVNALVDPCPANQDPANDSCFTDAGAILGAGGTGGGGGTDAGPSHKDAGADGGKTRDASADH